MSRSMTGFGRASSGGLTLSVKSVNHRGLDLHFHMPPALDPCEGALRNLLKERIARGSVQVRISLDGESQPAFNRTLLDSWLATFRQLAQELSLDTQPDLNAALRIPGMFQAGGASAAGPAEAEIVALAREALAEFNAFRDREGAALAAELRGRAETVAALASQIEDIRALATQAFQARLTERLSQLLESALEPHRLAHEAAILADRSDVSEELVRLRTHASQVEALLDAGGEIGKRLDFLLQEMNREANTILSKTSGLGDIGLRVTDLALACKSEIDKIREQSLNLE